MNLLGCNPYSLCDFGDKRLTRRAVLIAECLSIKYGQPLSTVFTSASDLKRGYEFFTNPKTTFEKLIEPYYQQTVQEISGLPVVLAVGDTTYLDYKKIVVKREDYGSTGNGGNGLILHTALAVDPDLGQPVGLLWQKLWHRKKPTQALEGETLQQKKQRLKQSRQLNRKRPIEVKESYRWVEAFQQVDKHLEDFYHHERVSKPKVIHIFDREGDISEVFEQASDMENTGVVVRAAHNRCLSNENLHLWEYVAAQPIQFILEVTLPETKNRSSRIASLEVRFCPVKLQPPSRLKDCDELNVYAVYAREINSPESAEPVAWMLLTTESVIIQQEASQILRWYTYRWRVEEYHKILKSGCLAESYRMGGESMSTLLGFLTVIAAQLLRMTYLHRNSPDAPAVLVLSPVQLDVLLALTPPKLKNPAQLTIDWAIRAIARLGGYLEHRRNTAIGITVLWRGWLQLESLRQGWQLHQNHN
jgi:hypothetical protein